MMVRSGSADIHGWLMVQSRFKDIVPWNTNFLLYCNCKSFLLTPRWHSNFTIRSLFVMVSTSRCLLFLAISAAMAPAFAAPDTDATQLDGLVVVGTEEQAAEQPGSAHVLAAEELEQSRVLSVNEALRRVPGVVVRDEEGFGLRPNIGIRGLNPSRSTKVLLLEDGLPFTYAPYGDNASYFHPPIERYERIEVLTGTGVLRFGPQTIGGVINYLTPEPPQELAGRIDLSAGSLGYRRIRAQVGANGHGVDIVAKEGDGARDNQSLAQRDLHYKGVLSLTDTQTLTLRASALNEDSDVTYSGLTDAEYRVLGPRYNPFVNDQFNVERVGTSATWSAAMGDRTTLAASAYYYEFHRDWARQSSTTTDTQCGSAFLNARLAGTRVDANTCNSRQNRNRDFTTLGFEPRLHTTWSLGQVESALETGVRFHRERQDRLQFNGTTPTATTGTLAENNERDVEAISAFVQNRFDFGSFALIPALRYESIDFERRNRLGAGSRGTETLQEWIPGIGATWDMSDSTTVYAGVHKGFAPPRVEDLIGANGGSVDVDAEESRNLEVGVRGQFSDHMTYQIAAFDNDFDNQIAVGSIASGSTPLAQGEARYRGVELSARTELPTWNSAWLPFAELAYTALPTAEQRSALRRVDNGQAVAGSAPGLRMPYAPRHTGSLRFGAERGAFDASMEAVYVGRQFADFANTEAAPLNGNGQVGALSSHTLVNVAVNYALPESGWTLYATMKNALDRQYIADRTRGILPGVERQVLFGATYAF